MNPTGGEPELITTTSIKVITPDGTMFVHVGEYDGGPKKVWMSIGKAGTTLSLWADALGRVISLALKNGVPLSRVIEEVSGLRSSHYRRMSNGATITSGPEGLSHGLMTYMSSKGGKDDDGDYRPARLNG